MPQARVTLQQIAERDGTHVTTVSLALRNSPKLPPATRQRIQTLAAAMGYVPDPALAALASYRRASKQGPGREILAYLTNWTSCWGWREHPAHARFFEGAQLAAAQLGYGIEHFWLGEPGLSHQRLSKIFAARGIRGVIVASHSRQSQQPLQLDWSSLSGVKIDYFPHQPMLPTVSNNQCDAIRLAVRKAREAGAQRVGLAMHRGWDMTVERRWTAGFLVEQTLFPSNQRIPICYFPPEEPRSAWENETEAEVRIEPQAFQSWLRQHRPDTLLGCRSFFDHKFPELGLQLVDLFLHEPNPTNPGIVQNHARVGAVAVEHLASRLARNDVGIPAIPSTTLIESTWNPGTAEL